MILLDKVTVNREADASVHVLFERICNREHVSAGLVPVVQQLLRRRPPSFS
jgi:hypothetical protein